MSSHGRGHGGAWSRWCFRSGAAVLAMGIVAAQQSVAQQAEQGGWDHTLIVRASYADYEAGPGVGQSAILYRSRPGHRWILSVGHNRLFGSEGYGYGVSYRRSWDRFRLGGGISSGANVRGGLYPRYHVGLTAGTNVAPGVPVSLSASRRRSARTDSYTDRIGLGIRWWAPGPWLLSASTTYAMGHPGDTHAWSGGAGITYMDWRRLHIGVDVHYGDGSYMLLPGQNVVEFTTWSYGATVTKYLSPDTGLSLSADYTDYYGGVSFRLGVSQRW